jgi:Domain of unknown function DUF11/FG-GAP-like repeat/Putative binding domain, N-terminal
MRSTSKKCIYIFAVYVLILIGVAVHADAQAGAVSAPALLHASNTSSSAISLRDGTAIVTTYSGNAAASSALMQHEARPASLSSGDFDEDGVPDLIAGYSTGSGGILSIHRGNINALWPYGDAVRSGLPPSFLPEARTFVLPESPDFIATGDFDADGHLDVVTARIGSNAIYFLRGDGHGSLGQPQRISLPGQITAMASGDINRRDGLDDLIITVNALDGAQALVFESPNGAVRAAPEMISLPAAARALSIGRIGGTPMSDVIVAAGNNLVVIHSRDRKLSLSPERRASVAPARVTVQSLSFAPLSIAAGDFTGAGPSVAALGDDGRLHILERTGAPDNWEGNSSVNSSSQSTVAIRGGRGKGPVVFSGTISPSIARRIAARQQAIASAFSNVPEWTERNAIALPAGFQQETPRLVVGHVSTSAQEDLLLADSGNNKVHVFFTGPKQLSASAQFSTEISTSTNAAPAPMALLASLDSAAAPAAVLSMRLNQHPLQSLVVLQATQSEPVVALSTPANVFTVTTTADGIGASIPAGSLRAAITAANAAAGPSSIVFNIPTTDPNRDPSTGVFLIRPLSENMNSLDFFALPPIDATVTIDGYTQPGANPNTLPNGDNAKILIEINGSAVTIPGGSGLVPFDSESSVFRGMVFTQWTQAHVNSDNTQNGGYGIEANGVGDFIEGNFFGTDATGTIVKANNDGIFADNGPEVGFTQGNIIGGTTPQARNLASGNVFVGFIANSNALELHIQGNFVGTDATGTIPLNPGQEGVVFNGSTIIVGGTLANTRNIISGNSANVDINDLTNGGAANGDLIQGNFIGTDVTGTQAVENIPVTGVALQSGPRNMIIGGTTPAARNIISGNQAYGVSFADDSLNNLVQGNYIGLDATGSKAIPNGVGFVTGNTPGSSQVPAEEATIGGAIPGAGNVISGNVGDGVQIFGTFTASGVYQGNTIQGNMIGTDATGTNSVPNGGNGVLISTAATNNLIGGSVPGQGNLIAHNTGNGVLIDPGPPLASGESQDNATVANTILSNGGAGVKVNSGINNLISKNSIFGNAELGIALGTGGPNINTNCNSSNTGPNNLQNAPTLTAGSGATIITATATDPNGNTSEFSNAVQTSLSGNILGLPGTLNSTPDTTYTIEFFSNTAADPSGFGQGQTYLGSTSVTTGATCGATINNPVNLTQADVSVVFTSTPSSLSVGPDFGANVYTSLVSNNGPATAHNVVFTDVLPPGLTVSSAYCNLATCQPPITTNLGTCSVSGNTVTCNLGTMPPGATATINIPVQTLSVGNIVNTVNVTATETDPNLANNMASSAITSTNPNPVIDHLDTKAALMNGPGFLLTIFGRNFLPTTTVTFNGNSLTPTLIDNQSCGISAPFTFCRGLQVQVPASLLTTAGNVTVAVANPSAGTNSTTFTIASACSFQFESFIPNLPSTIANTGTNLIAESVDVTANVSSCSWTASSSVSWVTVLDGPINGTSVNGTGNVDFDVTPNTTSTARTGTVTVAGKTFSFQQDPGATCSFTFGSPSASFLPAGGSGSVAVTATSTTSSQCSYFLVSFAPWITFPSGSTLLVGNANAQFTVAPNLGAPRTGNIMIGGTPFTITQSAQSCYFTLSAVAGTFPTSPSTGTFSVTANDPNCTWAAIPNPPSLVTISSGATGTGNGTVNFSVGANTAGAQVATITVGNSTANAVFTINQASADTCTFTLTPTSLNEPLEGVSDVFGITASYSFCQWTAVSNDPTAVTLTTAASNGATGNGAVYFAVAQDTGAPRTLTITAGCQTFTITQGFNPLPAIASLQPSSVVAGSSAFTLTVNGSNFVNTSVVNFNGTPRATTFVNATQLTAAILSSDVTTIGTAQVTVANPAPGGGTSNSTNFSITGGTNPAPTVTSLSPPSVMAGSGAFTLTVNGSNFISSSVVNFGGSARGTSFISATQLTAAILATDVASVGTPAITVTNPAPGGGTSNSISFNVTAGSNPVPAITSLSPMGVTAGSGALALTVNGSNFANTSVVNFAGSARATTFVSTTQLTAAILATDTASAGTPAITVTNPTPGGGTSNSVNFNISATANPAPTLTSISPTSAGAGGSAFTLTLSGTNFVAGSVAQWKGIVRTTTFISATQLTTAITAADIASSGTATITVVNPTPGGGTSNSLTFTITDFSVTGTTTTQTVTAGQPANFTIATAAVGGPFPGLITFAASGLPAGAGASFSPSSAAAGAGATMTITTTARGLAQIAAPPIAPNNSVRPLWLLTFAMLLTLGATIASAFANSDKFRSRTARHLIPIGAFALLLVSVGYISGCNGGGFPKIGSNAGTQAGSYTITVTGASGSDVHSTTVSLVVQ